jgi:2-aminobenzoate-CoA ligase
VVGWPDEERGQVVKAFVVLRAGHDAGEAMVRSLQDFVKATVAPYKYPRAIEFRAELPRTSTGKLQRFRLKPEGVGAAPDTGGAASPGSPGSRGGPGGASAVDAASGPGSAAAASNTSPGMFVANRGDAS